MVAKTTEATIDSVPKYRVYDAFMKTIGALAKEAGVGVETIRFYERKGLMKQPKRKGEGAFRRYPAEDAIRLRFIKRAQDLGFTLNEIKDLLVLNSTPNATCEDVRVRTERKIKEVEKKIGDLQRMRRALNAIESACDKNREAIACCRIMDCFEGDCC